jgi:uncharacterized Zn-finger protein
MHTGERPYACTFDGCHKRFSEKSGLKRHIATHTDIKPFPCTFVGCSKRFKDKSYLGKPLVVYLAGLI